MLGMSIPQIIQVQMTGNLFTGIQCLVYGRHSVMCDVGSKEDFTLSS